MVEPRTPQDLIDDDTAPLNELDHRRLARVERSLDRGLALQKWWQRKTKDWVHEYDGDELARIVTSGTHPDCFHLTRALPLWGKTETNYGFFDEASIDGQDRPVMGLFQQTFFDQPKRHFLTGAQDREAALDLWRNGLREFVLRYLIRLTGFYETTPYVDPQRRPVESWLRPFSWCPTEQERRGGFGFSQLYYKRRDSKRVGKFREADRTRIDLRRLEEELDWVVVGIRIHDLNMRHPAVSWLTLSIEDEVLAILSRDFILREDCPAHAGLRGRYGFGYAVLEDPAEEGSAILWQRPTFGFQANEFAVDHDGRILARMAMVTDKLPRLLAFDPWQWGRAAADRASLGFFSPAFNLGLALVDRTAPGVFAEGLRPLSQFMGGLAASPTPRFDPVSAFVAMLNLAPFDLPAKQLCISHDNLLRSLLTDFVRSQLSTVIASRGVWRAMADWTEESILPDWVKA